THMETTAYAITAIFCLLFIAAAIALIQYRERYLKAEEQKAVLEKKYRTTEHMLSRLIAEKTALQARFEDALGDIKVLTITNPEQKEGESDASHARRCRMTIGNKAAQYAEISMQTTTLRICITN
ncbi:MAG TPA: hypothetical protein PLR63_05975, partial [Paludibacteraceae bacterium]|nr:hypothetical protein [Paludibacteraceae bacterium]